MPVGKVFGIALDTNAPGGAGYGSILTDCGQTIRFDDDALEGGLTLTRSLDQVRVSCIIEGNQAIRVEPE